MQITEIQKKISEDLARLNGVTAAVGLSRIASIEQQYHVDVQYSVTEGIIEIHGYRTLKSFNS